MKEGQFVRIEFDAFVKESDQLMDTTHEAVAKEHDVFNERVKYEPIPVIIGAGQLIKGLDSDLLNAEVGVPREVEIEARDGYGERDPKLVEVVPLQKILSLPEFRKGDRYPQEGMEVHLNNRSGIISRIFAGRVRVDFNNRWAGKSLIYKYNVTEVIEGAEEKLRAVIESDFGRASEFAINMIDDETVEIILPDIVKLDTSWMMAKFKLVSDMRNHLGMKKVRFVEEYVRKEESEEETHDHDHDHGHDHEHDHADEAPAVEGAVEAPAEE